MPLWGGGQRASQETRDEAVYTTNTGLSLSVEAEPASGCGARFLGVEMKTRRCGICGQVVPEENFAGDVCFDCNNRYDEQGALFCLG